MRPSRELSQECMIHMRNFVKDGEKIKTTEEAINSEEVRKYIQACIDKTNEKAISRA